MNVTGDSVAQVSLVGRFFWFCAGADRSTLGRRACVLQRHRYTQIGMTVFLTAILASLSAAYTAFTVTASYSEAAALGLLWGFLIFNLDRLIVLTMRKQKGKFVRELLIASPRFLLAMMISAVISTPLEIKIFEKEIMGRILAADREKLVAESKKIDQRYGEIRELESANRALAAEIESKEGLRQRALEEATGEALGLRGTGIRGAGPVWKQKTGYFNQINKEVEELQRRNRETIDSNNKRIANLKDSRSKEIDNAAVSLSEGIGFQAKLEALHALVVDSFSTALYFGLLTGLFMVIETAPVISKFFAPYGPYEAICDRQEMETLIAEERKIEGISGKVDREARNDQLIHEATKNFELAQFQEVLAQAASHRELPAVHGRVVTRVITALESDMLRSVCRLFGADQDSDLVRSMRADAGRIQTDISREVKDPARTKARVDEAHAQILQELKSYARAIGSEH